MRVKVGGRVRPLRVLVHISSYHHVTEATRWGSKVGSLTAAQGSCSHYILPPCYTPLWALSGLLPLYIAIIVGPSAAALSGTQILISLSGNLHPTDTGDILPLDLNARIKVCTFVVTHRQTDRWCQNYYTRHVRDVGCNEKHTHHGFLAPQVYLCSTSSR